MDSCKHKHTFLCMKGDGQNDGSPLGLGQACIKPSTRLRAAQSVLGLGERTHHGPTSAATVSVTAALSSKIAPVSPRAQANKVRCSTLSGCTFSENAL